MQTEFIRCPICRNKTRVQIRDDTELKNFPLFCPKCRQVTLINITHQYYTIQNNSYQRARRIDAEPITRSREANGLSALFF